MKKVYTACLTAFIIFDTCRRLLHSESLTVEVKGEIINTLLTFKDIALEENGQCMRLSHDPQGSKVFHTRDGY